VEIKHQWAKQSDGKRAKSCNEIVRLISTEQSAAGLRGAVK